MEDFGWIIFLAVFWVLSVFGEQRKKQGRKGRQRDRERPDPDESMVEVGPAAGRRSLARDLEEGARRAEEALRRWEARQQQTEAASPTMRQAEARRTTEPPPSRRRTTMPASVDEQRREAYQAIAEMLDGRDPEAAEAPEDRQPEGPRLATVSPAARRPVYRAAQIGGPSLLTKGGTLVEARRPVAALDEPPVRTIESGLDRIERLPPLQRAVVWSELLGPPVALREDT